MLLRLALLALAVSALRRSDPDDVEDFDDASLDLEDLPDPEGLELSVMPKHRANASLSMKDTPFKNVLLVVHCRLKARKYLEYIRTPKNERVGGFPSPTSRVCAEREELFDGFFDIFPEVVFWTNDDCFPAPSNPHSCLPKLLAEKANYDGVLYMHFDALVKPNALKETFDPTAIGVFNAQNRCGWETGCGWQAWGAFRGRMAAAFDAMYAAGDVNVPVDKTHAWQGVDDLFYIPSSVFEKYGKLAGHLSRAVVHHEVLGPTLWRILKRETGVRVVDLGCRGGCCDEVDMEEANDSDLHCGHPFRLRETANRELFVQAMLAS